MAAAVATFARFGILRAVSWRRSKWSVSGFFGPSLGLVSKASSLLRLLLTSPLFSYGRSPRVRC